MKRVLFLVQRGLAKGNLNPKRSWSNAYSGSYATPEPRAPGPARNIDKRVGFDGRARSTALLFTFSIRTPKCTPCLKNSRDASLEPRTSQHCPQQEGWHQGSPP